MADRLSLDRAADTRPLWPFHLACMLIFSLPGALLCLFLWPLASSRAASIASLADFLALIGASLGFGTAMVALLGAQMRWKPPREVVPSRSLLRGGRPLAVSRPAAVLQRSLTPRAEASRSA